jgi:hypothetical protein
MWTEQVVLEDNDKFTHFRKPEQKRPLGGHRDSCRNNNKSAGY